MLLSQIDRHIVKSVQKYLIEVERNNIKVQKAYIFGSQATGTADKSSDIDVCIVSPDIKNPFDDGVFLTKIAGRDMSTILIEPHVMSAEDFSNPYSHLAYTVRNTGIPITIH